MRENPTVGKIVQLSDEQRRSPGAPRYKLPMELHPLRLSWMDMVREFHEKYSVPVSNSPDLIEYGVYTLRKNLHNEELTELHTAMSAVFDVHHRVQPTEDLTEIADAIADLIYVLIETALCYGIPLDEVFAEVHHSNMTKDGTRREDGKVLKGGSFEPPRIKEILDRAAETTT